MVNPITTSLPSYVEQNTTPLLKSVIFGADTTNYVGFQIAHGPTAINLIDAEVEFQAARGCGFNGNGKASHTQRNIDAKAIKLNMEFCAENYRDKYVNWMIDTERGTTNLPLEEYYMQAITNSAAYSLDKMLWQGDTASGTGQYKLIDGLIKTALGDSNTKKVDIVSGTSKIDAVKAVLAALPDEAFQEDTRVFCTPSFLRGYKDEQVEKNRFHYEVDAAAMEMYIPGTMVRLTAVRGLIGATKASDYDGILFGGRASRIVYGADTEDPTNRFMLDYDKKADSFYVNAKMVVGINYAISEEVVIAKLKTA